MPSLAQNDLPETSVGNIESVPCSTSVLPQVTQNHRGAKLLSYLSKLPIKGWRERGARGREGEKEGGREGGGREECFIHTYSYVI